MVLSRARRRAQRRQRVILAGAVTLAVLATVLRRAARGRRVRRLAEAARVADVRLAERNDRYAG